MGKQGLGGPTARCSWKIRQNESRQLAFFFDGNTHFVVFSGGVERGIGGLKARSSWIIRQNKGIEARRLDLAGLFTPKPAPLPLLLYLILS